MSATKETPQKVKSYFTWTAERQDGPMSAEEKTTRASAMIELLKAVCGDAANIEISYDESLVRAKVSAKITPAMRETADQRARAAITRGITGIYASALLFLRGQSKDTKELIIKELASRYLIEERGKALGILELRFRAMLALSKSA